MRPPCNGSRPGCPPSCANRPPSWPPPRGGRALQQALGKRFSPCAAPSPRSTRPSPWLKADDPMTLKAETREGNSPSSARCWLRKTNSRRPSAFKPVAREACPRLFKRRQAVARAPGASTRPQPAAPAASLAFSRSRNTATTSTVAAGARQIEIADNMVEMLPISFAAVSPSRASSASRNCKMVAVAARRGGAAAVERDDERGPRNQTAQESRQRALAADRGDRDMKGAGETDRRSAGRRAAAPPASSSSRARRCASMSRADPARDFARDRRIPPACG